MRALPQSIATQNKADNGAVRFSLLVLPASKRSNGVQKKCSGMLVSLPTYRFAATTGSLKRE